MSKPGFQFFGFNDIIYSNTISISQLKNKTEEDLDKAIILEKYRIYQEGKSLENKIIGLKEKSNKYKKYKDISREDYKKGRDLYNEINNLNQQEKELKKSIKEIDNRLNKLEDEMNIKQEINESISQDYIEFEKYEEEINKENIKIMRMIYSF